jgi:hypothetical protein
MFRRMWVVTPYGETCWFFNKWDFSEFFGVGFIVGMGIDSDRARGQDIGAGLLTNAGSLPGNLERWRTKSWKRRDSNGRLGYRALLL